MVCLWGFIDFILGYCEEWEVEEKTEYGMLLYIFILLFQLYSHSLNLVTYLETVISRCLENRPNTK